ncbi:MAG: DUF362 domain-containing protein [Candidatus Latescibacterota bacterium]
MVLAWVPAVLFLLPLAPASGVERATVAVTASDMAGLSRPCARDSVPSEEAVEEMVRQAMELGGIRRVLRPDARQVLLKPCIVVARRDPGRNTDPRAVRAVALLVHQIAPQARITVAEGPGAWMAQARPEVKHWELVIADGFETEGYRAALADPRLHDAQIEFLDLNLSEARLVRVPGGGWARDEYWIPAAVLDADVSITMPRLKTHMADHGGITVAMKNQIGVAPGLKYGWPKKSGYPSGSGNPGIPHSNEILGETITDLNLCADIDFAVAESFCRPLDREGMEREGGGSSWINGVVAGPDLVAVDAVSAYLMGFDPEEVETVVNGERRGLGVGRLEAIDLQGEKDLERLRRGFPVRHEDSRMGMANRIWIVSGPHPRTEAGLAAVDPAGALEPGSQGFGEPVWFQDDKCDLGQLLDKPTDCVAFAYCQFDAPRAEAAGLQVASDEGLTVWLNGVQVYRFDGWRRVERPNDTVPIRVQAGRNALLCRVEQTSRQFVFSANVVASEPSPLTGRPQRIAGLRFSAPHAEALRPLMDRESRFSEHWRERGWWRQALVDQTRPDSVVLDGLAPAALQARAAGIVRPRRFGDDTILRVVAHGERIAVRAAGVAECWIDAGSLRGAGQHGAVEVFELRRSWDEQARRPVETVRDSTVVWSGAVPGTPVLVLARPETTAAWQARWAASPPAAYTTDEVIGEAGGELSSGVYTLGPSQSTGGILLADAYRQAGGADLGLALSWEVGESLPAGPIRRGDLLDLVNPAGARLATWSLSGAQVDSVLEGLVGSGDARDTPQPAGFTARVDLSRPAGDRVALSLEPARQYRLCTLEWYTGWFAYLLRGPHPEGDGPPWVDLVTHPVTPVEAVEAFLAARRPYLPPPEVRLEAVGSAAPARP